MPLGKQVVEYVGLQIESWLKDVSRPTRFWKVLVSVVYRRRLSGHDFKKLETALNRARSYTA